MSSSVHDTYHRGDPGLESGKEPLDTCLSGERQGPLMLGFPVERSPWRKCSSSPVIAGLWILGTALLCLLRGLCHTLEQDGLPGKVPATFPAAIRHLSGCTGFWKSFLCFLQSDLLREHRVLCLLFMSLRSSQVGRQKEIIGENCNNLLGFQRVLP